MTALCSLLFGAVIGLSLGLTGGGGAIFAVPMLVYGLGTSPREAVGISLAAVGTTAFVGFLRRYRADAVEVRTGLLFAGAGMLGAPLGVAIAARLPETLLLLLFAGLMVVVAVRLWLSATPRVHEYSLDAHPETKPAACRRDAAGNLIFSTRCARLLLVVGIFTGILSGMFGVGGGFVIVPALVLFSQMPIHRAVGTSLLVVSLISLSGLISYWGSGQAIHVVTTVLFVVGGVTGLFGGQTLGSRLSGSTLQKVFAAAILVVATMVLVQNLR